VLLLAADGLGKTFLFEDHKSKATRLVRLSANHHLGRDDFTILGEVRLELWVARVVVQAAYEDLVISVLVHVDMRVAALGRIVHHGSIARGGTKPCNGLGRCSVTSDTACAAAVLTAVAVAVAVAIAIAIAIAIVNVVFAPPCSFLRPVC
jgi:hypothetical protein